MNNKECLSNWLLFIEEIVSLFNSGVSESEISKIFSGREVTWEGTISEIKLNEEYAPGVSILMTPELTKMKHGKLLRADHLFLNVDNESKADWEKREVGDKVKFTSTIVKSSGPFPEIQLSEDDDDPEVILMIGLYKSKLQLC